MINLPELKDSDDLKKFVEAAVDRKMKTLLHNVFYEPFAKHSDSYRLPDTENFVGKRCELGMPVPPAKTMRGYGPDPDVYLKTGKMNFEMMLSLLKKYGRPLSKNDRILDFGCGAGRMTRWLRLLGDGPGYYGTDVLGEDIFWAKQNLSDHFKFFTNIRLPHLPFEDNYFDFIFAGSVFTHIDDLAEAWLLELRRITKKGGHLYITLSDENSVDVLNNKRRDMLEQGVLMNRKDHIDKFDEYTSETFDMFTIRRSQVQSLRAESPQTFYSSDYFKRMGDSFFKVVGYEKNAYGFQSAAILRKLDKQSHKS